MSRCSKTRSVAQSQYEYFSEQSHGYILGNEININKKSDDGATMRNIKQAIQDAKNQGLPIQVGDLLHLEKNRHVHHAMIVSKIQDGMIYYAANSDDRFDKELSE